MDIKVEEIEPTRRRIRVEVPAEDVQKELDRAVGQVQRQARLKGFRPGKVPRSMVEKVYGEQIRADVLSHLIERTYAEAVENSGLHPVSQPEIVPESIERGQPLRFSATVDVQPAVEIGELAGLEAKRQVRPVTDEDVDRAIGRIRESLAELRPVEDRETAARGDFASIDSVLRLEGEELPDSRQENRLVEVGGGQVPEPVDQALDGMRVGETREADVPFPEDHPNEKIRGRTVRFVVTLRGIREKVLPPEDDDLAREHGECESLAELREKLRQRIDEAYREEADEQVRQQLVDGLLERHPFDVPGSLRERQVDALIQDLAQRSGIPAEQLLQQDPERSEKLREELRPRAERQIRASLLLDAVAEHESIQVPDEDVDRKLEEMAARAGEQAERIRALYREPSVREELARRLRRERALDHLVSVARVEEETA